MFKNYLLIGLRSLSKHRFYSIINIMGLALGLSACLLLTIWVIHETSYDNFHQKSSRIFRPSLEYSFGGQHAKTSVSPTALLPALEKNLPEIENGVRVYNVTSFNPFLIRYEDKAFQENRFYYADSTFFDVFTFPLLEGDPGTALRSPNSVVLTRSAARKYFGTADPLGKSLQINNSTEYLVTGLIDDVPGNTLLQFDFIASFSSLEASKEQIWWSANYQTYVVLTAGADLKAVDDKTQSMIKAALANELGNPGDYVRYNFIPLTDIYLKSDMEEYVPVSDIQYIYIFGAIAALVLTIACINYVNLATARAAERAREVGVRKVVGAARNQLFFQFIGESMIITTLALGVAIFLTRLAIPGFNSLTGKSFDSEVLFNPVSLASVGIASIFIALLAGAYPAVAITSFKPVQVLKGNFKTSGKGVWLRQSLVIFQFCISVMLIIGTLVVSKQLDYIQNKRLGYDRENIIALPLDGKMSKVYDQIKAEVLKNGTALQISRATESPTAISGGYSLTLPGSGNNRGMLVTAMSVDNDFISTTGIELAHGRNFNDADLKKLTQDTISSFMLNEAALQEIGIPNDKAVGTKIEMNGRSGEIIGVIKDFHFASLQKRITPLVFFNDPGDFGYIFIRLAPGNTGDALSAVQAVFQKLASHRPFEYTFLDQEYGRMYDNEMRMGRIVTTFALMTIAIACLGLLGLVSFSAAQKTKEIGIRKVMGATPFSIVVLITRDFTVLVLIAIVIGVPAGYWIMSGWLSGFAYRTSIGVLPLLIASALSIIIALATASYQAIVASRLDPARTLRSE